MHYEQDNNTKSVFKWRIIGLNSGFILLDWLLFGEHSYAREPTPKILTLYYDFTVIEEFAK